MMGADAVRCSSGSGGGSGGGYDGSPHTYWRIYITSTNGDSGFIAQINELEFRATVGGSSQSTGGTASGSSTYGGTYDYPGAFDGSAATGWACANNATLPQWLTYQHTSAVSAAEVMIQAGDNADRAARAPIDFEIQYSDDGSTWATALSVTGEPAWAISEIRTYAL